MMVEKYRRTPDKYFCQNCKDRNWIVQCKCGCSLTLLRCDKLGREGRFIDGHQLIVFKTEIGEKHHGWKGENVSYYGLHRWIRRNMSKPKDGLCELCHQVQFREAANLAGIYNREFKNWAWFCHKCHMKWDNSGTRANLKNRKKP